MELFYQFRVLRIVENWWINYISQNPSLDSIAFVCILSNDTTKVSTIKLNLALSSPTKTRRGWRIKFIMSDGKCLRGRTGGIEQKRTRRNRENLKQKQTEITGFKPFRLLLLIFGRFLFMHLVLSVFLGRVLFSFYANQCNATCTSKRDLSL